MVDSEIKKTIPQFPYQLIYDLQDKLSQGYLRSTLPVAQLLQHGERHFWELGEEKMRKSPRLMDTKMVCSVFFLCLWSDNILHLFSATFQWRTETFFAGLMPFRPRSWRVNTPAQQEPPMWPMRTASCPRSVLEGQTWQGNDGEKVESHILGTWLNLMVLVCLRCALQHHSGVKFHQSQLFFRVHQVHPWWSEVFDWNLGIWLELRTRASKSSCPISTTSAGWSPWFALHVRAFAPRISWGMGK